MRVAAKTDGQTVIQTESINFSEVLKSVKNTFNLCSKVLEK